MIPKDFAWVTIESLEGLIVNEESSSHQVYQSSRLAISSDFSHNQEGMLMASFQVQEFTDSLIQLTLTLLSVSTDFEINI